jgi:hypothetical protein
MSDFIAVEFDDTTVNVRVLADWSDDWNQSFNWSDVGRTCFKDEGIYKSDLIFLTVAGREKVVVVPTEAANGDAFFGEICKRGLLPEHVWRKAIGSTNGGMFCWPEARLDG